MESTVVSIHKDILSSFDNSLSHQELINEFLDDINIKKDIIIGLTNDIEEQIKCYTKLTWIDGINEKDEILLKGIIAMGRHVNHKLRSSYKRIASRSEELGLFENELQDLNQAIEDHIEVIDEVAIIFFDIRKDDEVTSIFEDISKL